MDNIDVRWTLTCVRYLMVTEEGSGKLVGVIIKKRLVGYLEHLHQHGGDDE